MSSQREHWIERDFLVGVVDAEDRAEATVNDLAVAGVPRETVQVFHGEEGRAELRKAGGEGLLGRIRRGLEEYVGAAKDMTERHQEESALGHYVVIVPLPDIEMADRVRHVLYAHEGHDLFIHRGSMYEEL